MVKRKEFGIAKKLDVDSHAPKLEIKHILRNARINSQSLFDKYNKAIDSFDICASTGAATHTINISLTKINEAFNQCIQVSITVVYNRIKKFKVFIMFHLGTKNSYRTIAPNKSFETMHTLLDSDF